MQKKRDFNSNEIQIFLLVIKPIIPLYVGLYFIMHSIPLKGATNTTGGTDTTWGTDTTFGSKLWYIFYLLDNIGTIYSALKHEKRHYEHMKFSG